MAKSIIQDDRSYCFLCGRNGYADPLEEHHIFGGNPDRKLSEHDGLKVYLCANRCHRNGPKSAHLCRETSDYLHRIGQEAWEKKYGPREAFIQRYRKNYIY